MWSGAGGFIVTTGTLVVLMPPTEPELLSLPRCFAGVVKDKLVLSSLARCLTYCEKCRFVVEWSMMFGSFEEL